MIAVAAAVSVWITLAGCGQQAPVASTPPATAALPGAATYHVGIGDHLKISVYNSDKFSGEFVVAGDGTIAFPLLRRVPVGGLSLDDVGKLLEQRLGDGYLLNPSVNVEVASFRQVSILGEVEHPGQYPYAEGMTVFKLVAQAGGFTYRGSRKTVRMRHDGEEQDHRLPVNASTPVSPGDTVIVLQRFL